MKNRLGFLLFSEKIKTESIKLKARIKEIKELLSQQKNIVIVPHKNPDGDAIGASLALSLYLTKRGHNATVVSPNDSPNFLKWLPGFDKILRFDMKNKGII